VLASYHDNMTSDGSIGSNKQYIHKSIMPVLRTLNGRLQDIANFLDKEWYDVLFARINTWLEK
jgi:hypothetical protein